MLLPMLLLGITVFLKIKGYQIQDAKRKYEFKNRTSGGTVEFKTFEESKSHEKQKTWGGFLSHLGNMGIVITIISFAYKILIAKN
ncbi:hypothetical protein [Flavivirga sp. 57AJ16]|uniref:hypothetical protein n=1 Tax=Flavivirga sp. 57AJ16 TaxID=3025307 RepID=UPI002366FF6A|nr:hypothetical protein [Flavivirga sp. 57AJ16]MDD7887861.1 hypothetical protein [Flavivirga sp. 57AJ16]